MALSNMLECQILLLKYNRWSEMYKLQCSANCITPARKPNIIPCFNIKLRWSGNPYDGLVEETAIQSSDKYSTTDIVNLLQKHVVDGGHDIKFDVNGELRNRDIDEDIVNQCLPLYNGKQTVMSGVVTDHISSVFPTYPK